MSNAPGGLLKPPQTGAYQGGLPMGWDPNGGKPVYNSLPYSGNDQDVKSAMAAQNQMNEETRGDTGVDWNAQKALLTQAQGRIATKNALSEFMGNEPDQLASKINGLNQQAGSALGEGLNNTRNNYNSRGLLYSGMREGAEQQERGAVSGQLAAGTANARRESANSVNAAKTAYGTVELQSGEQNLLMAHQAFDTANQNSIARAQAMQQLGQGVGQAAGAIAGHYYGGSPNPTSGWNPNGMTQPEIGSEFSPTTTRGLLGVNTELRPTG